MTEREDDLDEEWWDGAVEEPVDDISEEICGEEDTLLWATIAVLAGLAVLVLAAICVGVLALVL